LEVLAVRLLDLVLLEETAVQVGHVAQELIGLGRSVGRLLRESLEEQWRQEPAEVAVTNCRRHWAITVGCTWNAELNSLNVRTPFTASNATFALNSSAYCRRFLDSTALPCRWTLS